MTENEWTEHAKNLLKAELKLRGVDYKSLADRLKANGINETYHSINNKMNRGTFSFVFALQCLNAIGAEEIRLPVGKV
ncbi:DUF6471 domain-containing protein [Methylotenera sp. G11]|uniref:DUF6471 domain-containing protein n=1 Tax=Methylotenera sp. G11 TaxID=1506585 RepID=UPI000647AF80|nr:DUF6471 domain-containing protein [Methylotenera sp. G11]